MSLVIIEGMDPVHRRAYRDGYRDALRAKEYNDEGGFGIHKGTYQAAYKNGYEDSKEDFPKGLNETSGSQPNSV